MSITMPDPIAIRLGPLTIYWYGICVAIGFMLVYLLVRKRGKAKGISEDTVADLMTWTAVSALLGARLFYVITFWNEQFSGKSFLKIFAIWEGGLVFYGGFISAAMLISSGKLAKTFT